MTFRFAARYGLLTYSQSPGLDPFRIVELLSKLGAECIVGRELHEDGGTHYHAFFMFNSEFRTRNPRVFDIDEYHPNILRGRKTPEQMFDYATKDGEIVAGGLERPQPRPSATADSDSFWRDVFAAETREETLRVARESNVGLFGRYFFQVRAIAESKAVQNPLDYVSPPELAWELRPYPELSDWCETYLGRRGGRLVIPFHYPSFASSGGPTVLRNAIFLFGRSSISCARPSVGPLASLKQWPRHGIEGRARRCILIP